MNISTMLSNNELRGFIFSEYDKNLYISPRNGYKTLSLLFKMMITAENKKEYCRPLYICKNEAGIRTAANTMVKLLEKNDITVKCNNKINNNLIKIETDKNIYYFATCDFLNDSWSRGYKFSDFYIDEPDTFDFNIYKDFLFTLYYLSFWDEKATYNFAGTMIHNKINLYNLSADLEYKRFYNNEKTIGMTQELINKFKNELSDITFTTEIMARFIRRPKNFNE